MSLTYEDLIKRNRVWVEEQLGIESGYFETLSQGQSPVALFVGCSDSRVSPNLITNSDLGDLFVHRNIANQIHLDDGNFLSVLQYSVEALKVKHIIVCGHHGCGGVEAALMGKGDGVLKDWIAPIRQVYLDNKDVIDALDNSKDKVNTLSELNVMKQIQNLYDTDVMKTAKNADSCPQVHAWMFEMDSGVIRDLTHDIS